MTESVAENVAPANTGRVFLDLKSETIELLRKAFKAIPEDREERDKIRPAIQALCGVLKDGSYGNPMGFYNIDSASERIPYVLGSLYRTISTVSPHGALRNNSLCDGLRIAIFKADPERCNDAINDAIRDIEEQCRKLDIKLNTKEKIVRISDATKTLLHGAIENPAENWSDQVKNSAIVGVIRLCGERRNGAFDDPAGFPSARDAAREMHYILGPLARDLDDVVMDDARILEMKKYRVYPLDISI